MPKASATSVEESKRLLGGKAGTWKMEEKQKRETRLMMLKNIGVRLQVGRKNGSLG
jgi:hypothetical protein